MTKQLSARFHQHGATQTVDMLLNFENYAPRDLAKRLQEFAQIMNAIADTSALIQETTRPYHERLD